jgi:Uma2 family endonuclease
MSTPARVQDLVSVEEYLAADVAREDARLEYVAGHIFALAGATKRHAVISGNIYARLHAATEGLNCRVYQSDVRLRVSADLYFYPDVMVACRDDLHDEDPMDETAPHVLVEVLSEGTAERDLGLKLAVYRDLPSLRMYLIISQDERRVELHWRARLGGAWQKDVVSGTGTITIPSLNATITLDQIYARLVM